MSYDNPPPPPPGGGPPPPPPPGGGTPPPGGYGQPAPYGGQPQQKNSVMAIIGLITGILGVIPFCCLGTFILSIAAVVLGYLGGKEIRESNGAKKGEGMAKAALILGIAGIVLGILWWILVASIGTFDYSYYNEL